MAKHCILVVDGDKSIRDDMALKLRAAGYIVKTAKHGLDALLQLETLSLPDVIISNFNAPHISGLEFLAVVRRRFPQIPLIGFDGQSGQLYELPVLVPAESRVAVPQSSRAA